MASIKSPKQLKEENPDWSKEQVIESFDKSLNRKIKGIKKDLQGIKDILDTDPMWERDVWAGWYSVFLGKAIAFLKPNFGNPLDFDDENEGTPEQEAVFAEFFRTISDEK